MFDNMMHSSTLSPEKMAQAAELLRSFGIDANSAGVPEKTTDVRIANA